MAKFLAFILSLIIVISCLVTVQYAVDKTAYQMSGLEREFFDEINKIRKDRGLAPLEHYPMLSVVANERSRDMAENRYFSHKSPTLGSAQRMLARRLVIFFKTGGENIAMGKLSRGNAVDKTVSAWLESSGHKAHILNDEYTKTGIGIARDESGKTYITQLFIG